MSSGTGVNSSGENATSEKGTIESGAVDSSTMESRPAQDRFVESGEKRSVWRVLSASVVGRAHLAQGRGNEDAVKTAVLPNDTVLLALADGAGSAKQGGEGARLAVQSAIEALSAAAGDPTGETADEALGAATREAASEAPGEATREALGEATDEAPAEALGEAALRGALVHVRRAVAAHARRSGVRPREFACTLLLALARGDTLAVLQVGDGAAVTGGLAGGGLPGNNGGWKRVTRPVRGPHAGETVFVTSRRAALLAEVATLSLAEVGAIALMSDGLEPVATDVATEAPHAPFFEPLTTFAAGDRQTAELEAELARFLSSERVQARSHDDLSLILAVRR